MILNMTSLVQEGAVVTLHRLLDVPLEIGISVPYLLQQKKACERGCFIANAKESII